MTSLHILGSKEMGGAERWLVRFVRAMLRHGESVEVIVRRDSDLARHHLDGVDMRESPMRTVWDPLSRWQLSRLIAKSEAPIVQTYMGRATRLTHLERGRGKVHLSRLGGYYKLTPFRHAHAWIGNTKGLCDWMIQGGLPAERVFHITNFADPAKALDPDAQHALRQQLALQPEDWLIVTAGRLIDVKGQATLIDAFSQLPAELGGKRLRLVLLGDGPLREALETQARQLGVAERVHFAGWQHDPSQWFHLADMVAFPSRDAETLGNVILEAWAYGKPLACTAFRGAREIARHGQDAWISPCDDAAALAAGMREVIANEALQRDLVRAGARRIEAEFSEAAVIDQYRALYAQLLDNR
ncbi:MAG: glycosyltransferase [Proteobacteria bacterium]|nr:MAG: glycosyltransferase [Pseudomonadota bacterium]